MTEVEKATKSMPNLIRMSEVIGLFSKYIYECRRPEGCVFPTFVVPQNEDKTMFCADMEAAPVPIVSEYIPLPEYIQDSMRVLAEQSSDMSCQEFKVIKGWKSFPIYTPLLTLMLTGKPCQLLAKKLEYDGNTELGAFDPEKEKPRSSTKMIHAMTLMNQRKFAHFVSSYKSQGWPPVKTTVDIGHFYDMVIDAIAANQTKVSGFYGTVWSTQLSYRHAFDGMVDDMEKIKANIQTGHCSDEEVVEMVLRAKERFILMAAGIPKEYHRYFVIPHRFGTPSPDDFPDVFETAKIQNQQLDDLRSESSPSASSH